MADFQRGGKRVPERTRIRHEGRKRGRSVGMRDEEIIRVVGVNIEEKCGGRK